MHMRSHEVLRRLGSVHLLDGTHQKLQGARGAEPGREPVVIVSTEDVEEFDVPVCSSSADAAGESSDWLPHAWARARTRRMGAAS